MEWLEFKPWSPEVSQKVAAIQAADATQNARAPKAAEPKKTDGWQARLTTWPTHNPWGALDA